MVGSGAAMQADVQGSKLACVLESAYSARRAGELVDEVTAFARRFEQERSGTGEVGAPRTTATRPLVRT